jgi:lipoprotein-releasing system ATP-binding protein
MILQAKKLVKSFYTPTKLTVLKGVDLSVEEGETLAIMGKSGEGKTTLLHLLGTLELPCSGELFFREAKIEPSSFATLRCEKMGFIFQSYNLLEDFTLLENVLMPAKVARKATKPGSPSYKRALHLIEQVGLADRAHFHSKLLSGGEKQRAAIARALCNDPDLIFADEPSGSLDHGHSQEIHQLLIQTVRHHKKALVVVTHDSELASLCDRKLLLKEGHLTCIS